jgi:hypothetical protein
MSDDTKVIDADGNTIEKDSKFHISGMEQFTGVVLEIIGPDVNQWPKVKVKYDQPPEDEEYLPCWQIGTGELYSCNEIVVWQE